MNFSWDLLVNAIITGVVLGGFYAAAAIGVTIEFGMLDIVNIAHPAFMIVGAYLAYLGWNQFRIRPVRRNGRLRAVRIIFWQGVLSGLSFFL